MTRVVAGLGLAAALASIASVWGCGPNDAGSDGGIGIADANSEKHYAGDGPVYNFSDDAGMSDVTDGGPLGDGAVALFLTDTVLFGYLECGGAPATLTFPILNDGTADLIVSAKTTGTAFSVTPASLTIPVGTTGMFTMSATVPGSAVAGMPLTGSLDLATNDPTRASASVPLSVVPTGATIVLQSPSNTISLPSADVGQQAVQELKVANTGNSTAAVTIGAPSDVHFLLSGLPDGGGLTLNGGDTWTGTVSFTPHDTSMATATSTVEVKGSQCGQSVSSISFSAQGAHGQLSGYPRAPIDFGPANCGGAAPAPQSFRLTNTSPVDVRIAQASIVPSSSGFTTDAQPGRWLIANGGSYTIHVNAPPVLGPLPLTPITATLNIQTDGDTSPHAITLQEEPQGAVLAFDPSATPNFGSFGQVVLLFSASQNFSVMNTGNGPATVSLHTASSSPPGDLGDAGADATVGRDATVGAGADASVAQQPFRISNPTFTLAAGATQTDAVTFVPSAGTNYVDGIVMTATGAICSALPSPIPLSGVGFGGGPSINPSGLDFLATCGGTAPGDQVVSLTNRGPANMHWSISPITGPGAAQYTMIPLLPPGLLPPGSRVDIRVSAAAIPSPAPNPDPAALSAQFTITTDVPLDNPHVVPLTETPIGDRLSFSVPNLRFGQFPIDYTTPPQTFTITNAANPGSGAASIALSLVGSTGTTYVEPADGGTVCVVTADGGAVDAAGSCPASTSDGGDGGDGGEAGGCPDGGDGGDCGGPPMAVNAGYVMVPQGFDNLAPGGGISAPATVTFIPMAAIAYPATIAIQTYDPLCSALPAPIQVMGSGTQGQVSVSATALAFGTDPKDPLGLVNCGATGLTQTVYVMNTGNQVFSITGLALGAGASSPFKLNASNPALPTTVPIGGTISIPVTPNPIPVNVANPNDPSPFSDTLTITTDAVFDVPHTVSLVMQARGAVIADRAIDSNWTFGTVTVGSIGTFASSIGNSGNAPAAVALAGLTHPTIFGLQSNPTVVAPNAATAFVGQFVPPSENQSWTDQGTLVVTTPQVFCEPLPAAWNSPTITLSGSSSANSPVTVSGSLAFPATDCGTGAPSGQTLTLTNNTNQTYAYAMRFSSGAFYAITDAGPGTIAANGNATIVVSPKTVVPGQGVQAGSAPYADSLVVNAFPATGDAGAIGATSLTVPITWTLSGAMLSLPQGAGPRTDVLGKAFYPADTTSGYALPMANGGTKAVTVTVVTQPSNVFTFSPATPQMIPAGGQGSPLMTNTASDAVCPATTSANTTFFYSGPVCQPFQMPQVSVRACSGTEEAPF